MSALSRFRSIVFFTGAGISKESGIPTYRGPGGLWHEYNYEDYACQKAFDDDPVKVWEFHKKRRSFVIEKEPNRAHEVIAEAEKKLDQVTVITQNIDGLHQRAGSAKVLELHGSLWRVRCDDEGKVFEAPDVPMPSQRCSCGAWLRPDIVWFGDSLNFEVTEAAFEVLRNCDLLVSVGTSGVVYPAASFPEIARRVGATMIEVNPQETPLSALYDHVMRGPASEMLEDLWSDEDLGRVLGAD